MLRALGRASGGLTASAHTPTRDRGNSDMQRRHFSWVVLIVVALVSGVAVSAAAALGARSAAHSFEIVAVDRYEPCWFSFECVSGDGHDATFSSAGPFCESGTVDFVSEQRGETVRRYTCADGSGSLALAERVDPSAPFVGGEWTIVEGSGRYEDLHGKGGYFSEHLDNQPEVVWRTSMRGLADYDSVAPSVAITSATATKLSRLAATYSIRVAFSLRDDDDANPVTYRLAVKEGPRGRSGLPRPDLDSTEGSTAPGSVTTTLRIWPSSKRVRFVQLLLSGSDPVGNEASLVRWLELPR